MFGPIFLPSPGGTWYKSCTPYSLTGTKELYAYCEVTPPVSAMTAPKYSNRFTSLDTSYCTPNSVATSPKGILMCNPNSNLPGGFPSGDPSGAPPCLGLVAFQSVVRVPSSLHVVRLFHMFDTISNNIDDCLFKIGIRNTKAWIQEGVFYRRSCIEYDHISIHELSWFKFIMLHSVSSSSCMHWTAFNVLYCYLSMCLRTSMA